MTFRPVEHEPERYWVNSETDPNGPPHMVDTNYDGKPACSCHDFMCREHECKHIRHLRECGVIKTPTPTQPHYEV